MNERTIETITNYYLDQKESIWKVFDVMATKMMILFMFSNDR